MPGADGPQLAAAKRLLDAAKDAGFTFARIAPGPDGPLRGTRQTREWTDEIYVGGFTDSCTALRRRRSSLVVPNGQPVAARVHGDAIEVLHTVVVDSLARLNTKGRQDTGPIVDLRWSRHHARRSLVIGVRSGSELNRIQSLNGWAEDQTRSKLAT